MLDINTREEGAATIIDIKGDVDLYSSPNLRKTVIGLTKKKVKNILVDLSAVGYMDSSGVATLVEGLQQVGKYKGSLKLFGLDSAVKEVFELSRLDKVFEIYRTEKEALSEVN